MRLKLKVDICKGWGYFKHAAYLEGRIYTRFPDIKLNFNVETDKYLSGRFDIWVWTEGEWSLVYSKDKAGDMPDKTTIENVIEEISGFMKWGDWDLSGKYEPDELNKGLAL